MNDPQSIARSIVKRISVDGTCTYPSLSDRAKERAIPQGIFDNAMTLIHRNRTILVKNVKGVLTYSIKPPSVAKTPVDILAEWKKEHPYPYPIKCKHCSGALCPLCFPFYDPEKDTPGKIRERIMMTREQYKALTS